MIHPDDLEALEKVFRNSEIPDDVQREYEIVRGLADCYGLAGPLGRELTIGILRRLSYGRVEANTEVQNVDWRKHIGEEVVGHYGDQKVPGKLVSLGVNGRLVVDLEKYGEVELPRYCVKLIPRTVVAEKDVDWKMVDVGTPVEAVKDGKGTKGKFLSVEDDGLKVKVGTKHVVFPIADVSLVEGE